MNNKQSNNEGRNFKMRISRPRPTEKNMDYPPSSFEDLTKKIEIALSQGFIETKLVDNTKEQEAVLNKRNPNRKVKRETKTRGFTIDM